jgi:hypothetical protein
MNPDSMEHSHGECSAVQTVNKFIVLWNPSVYYLDHNGGLMDNILGWMNSLISWQIKSHMFQQNSLNSKGVEILAPFPIIYICVPSYDGARGRQVGWGTMLQARRSRVRVTLRCIFFSIYLILPAKPWPWGRLTVWLSVSNRNEYQESSWG